LVIQQSEGCVVCLFVCLFVCFQDLNITVCWYNRERFGILRPDYTVQPHRYYISWYD